MSHDPPPAHRPTASVALATCNGARFLGAQLESILAQTELPDEIVVTDDGSIDDTLAVLANYAARSPIPIRVHANEGRLGFARNFARAIGLCGSDLIFLCDQDDVWLPGKVALMKAAFDDPAVLLAYHGALVVTAEDQPLYPFTQADRERALLATKPIDPWYSSYGLTQVFRSSLRRFDDLWPDSLNHVWIEDEPLSHDQWYFFLAQVLGKVTYVDAVLVRYRQHGANSVGAEPSGGADGPLRRWRARFSHDPRRDRLRAAAGERRAAILATMSGRTDAAAAARAAMLAVRYGELAARLRRRHRTCTAPGVSERVGSFAWSIAQGDYGAGPWKLNRLSIVRDVVNGIAGRRERPDTV